MIASFSNFLARLPIVRQILAQPLVTATGAAAFIHSSWTLATLFGGIEPKQFTGDWLAWLVPGALIAFAVDLGQIVTSAELRSGERSKAKYATFATFAAFTYLLQMIYMIEHVPALGIAPGVRADFVPLVTVIRDSAIFFIPALLPLSTLLYTFSYGKPKKQPVTKPVTVVPQGQANKEELSLVAVARSNGTELTVGVSNKPSMVDRARAKYASDVTLRDKPTRWLEENAADEWGKIGRNAWNEARK